MIKIELYRLTDEKINNNDDVPTNRFTSTSLGTVWNDQRDVEDTSVWNCLTMHTKMSKANRPILNNVNIQ